MSRVLKKFFIITLIVTFSLIIILTSSLLVRHLLVKDYLRYDKQIYDNKSYQNHPYETIREDVTEFFDKYTTTNNSVNYNFYMLDGDKTLFFATSYSLILKYTETDYFAEKTRIESHIDFFSEDKSRDGYHTVFKEVKINNYVFKHILDESAYYLYTDTLTNTTTFKLSNSIPKPIKLIAFNDTEHIISYNLICDYSIDYYKNEKDYIKYLKGNLRYIVDGEKFD